MWPTLFSAIVLFSKFSGFASMIMITIMYEITVNPVFIAVIIFETLRCLFFEVAFEFVHVDNTPGPRAKCVYTGNRNSAGWSNKVLKKFFLKPVADKIQITDNNKLGRIFNDGKSQT